MKKPCILILFILTSVMACAQQKGYSSKKLTNDTIVWKQDSLLKQDDFKMKTKPSGSYVEGLACTGILFYPKESGGTIKFYIQAIFIKSKSFLKDNSEYTLKHEQLHFDIAELYARKMRQKLTETDFTKVKNIQQEFNSVFSKTYLECEKEEDKYDNDTQHGINPAKQKLWKKIFRNNCRHWTVLAPLKWTLPGDLRVRRLKSLKV